MKYYYLHIWSSGDLDRETQLDKSTHPPRVSNPGIEIDSWPADDLFYSFPVFIVTDRLRANLVYWGYDKISFVKIERVSKGLNFLENFPNTDLPKLWLLKFDGIPMKCDISIWQGKYLVVSENALHFLRDNHVTHAEYDLILGDIDDYFNDGKHKFWMK